MKYFADAKCEIKFAFQHLRSKYFIRVSVFHSEAISLAERRISLKKGLHFREVLFSGSPCWTWTNDLRINRRLDFSYIYFFFSIMSGSPGNNGFCGSNGTTFLPLFPCFPFYFVSVFVSNKWQHKPREPTTIGFLHICCVRLYGFK